MSRALVGVTKRSLGIGVIAAVISLLAATPAMARTFSPNKLTDPAPNGCKRHDCSLREAVIAANNHSGADKILLRAGKRYKLTIAGSDDDAALGDLDLKGTLAVKSSGARRAQIAAPGLDGIFDAETTPSRFSATSLTLTGADVGIVAGKRVVVVGCQFRGAAMGAGVVGTASVAVRSSRFISLNGVGVVAAGVSGRASVTGSVFKKIGGIAVEIVGNSRSSVTSSRIERSPVGLLASTAKPFAMNRVSIIRGAGIGLSVASLAKVTMRGSTIRGFASSGGLVQARSVEVSNSSVSRNGNGGAGLFLIGLGPTGHATVKRSSFTRNRGGGLQLLGGFTSATVADSTFSGNRGTTGAGGLVALSGRVTITDSTFSGNRALSSAGGGLFAVGTRVSATNSTIASNRAAEEGGGAVLIGSGPAGVTARSLTVVRNRADTDNTGSDEGGGLIGSGAKLKIFNSVLGYNRVGTGSTDPDCVGVFTVARNNARSKASAGCTGFNGHGNFLSKHLRIGKLRDNGGPTKTVCPLHGSLLLDAAAGPPKVDQRGHKRTRKPDIGACEP